MKNKKMRQLMQEYRSIPLSEEQDGLKKYRLHKPTPVRQVFRPVNSRFIAVIASVLVIITVLPVLFWVILPTKSAPVSIDNGSSNGNYYSQNTAENKSYDTQIGQSSSVEEINEFLKEITFTAYGEVTCYVTTVPFDEEVSYYHCDVFEEKTFNVLDVNFFTTENYYKMNPYFISWTYEKRFLGGTLYYQVDDEGDMYIYKGILVFDGKIVQIQKACSYVHAKISLTDFLQLYFSEKTE